MKQITKQYANRQYELHRDEVLGHLRSLVQGEYDGEAIVLATVRSISAQTGVPITGVYWALHGLIEEGTVRMVRRGVYAI